MTMTAVLSVREFLKGCTCIVIIIIVVIVNLLFLMLMLYFVRVDWLHRGSREMFGTVVENRIYLLIDMSASMQAHIQFVKDKIFLLMQVRIISLLICHYIVQFEIMALYEKRKHGKWPSTSLSS